MLTVNITCSASFNQIRRAIIGIIVIQQRSIARKEVSKSNDDSQVLRPNGSWRYSVEELEICPGILHLIHPKILFCTLNVNESLSMDLSIRVSISTSVPLR
jgi:hypothetical protein